MKDAAKFKALKDARIRFITGTNRGKVAWLRYLGEVEAIKAGADA